MFVELYEKILICSVVIKYINILKYLGDMKSRRR